ncbi:MAG: APC family permease [Thermoleophilia bacterium]|nr:APC family permease [Thermoleophilia bacterium]
MRRLEFPFYLSVGVGMALSCSSFMMVAGLFEVTSLLWILLALVLGCVFCGALALSIGELAGMYPSAPAIVTYFKAAFGDRIALMFIYLYLVFIVLIAGVESYLFGKVAEAVVPGLPPLAVVVVLLVSVVTANLLGLELPRLIQMVLTAAAVAVILVLGVAGAVRSPGATADALGTGNVLSSLGLVPAAVGLTVFLFMGFEWVTPVGLRPDAYARKIPWAMPAAVAILFVAYALFLVGIGATLPRSAFKDELIPQVPFFADVLGGTGKYLAGILSLSAIVSTFNAGMMSASRLIYAVARQGYLPRFVATIRPSTGAPVGGVLLLGSLGLASAFVVGGLGLQLVAAVVGATIICAIYAGYIGSALRLRARDPDRPRPFRSPLPAGVQKGVIGLLAIIGAASLFSLPDRIPEAVVGGALSALVAYLLSGWSIRRSPRPALARRGVAPSARAR